MKTYVLGILFLGFTNLMIAQNDLAILTPSNTTVYSSSKTVLNTDYLNTVTHQDISKKIENLQKVVANFDIQMNKIYKSKTHSNYTVDFKEGDNSITAIYNKNGELLSCEENYQAVKLPYFVSSKLSKDYPNWYIKKVQCDIKYTKNKEPKVTYKVAINNGNKTKNIFIKV